MAKKKKTAVVPEQPVPTAPPAKAEASHAGSDNTVLLTENIAYDWDSNSLSLVKPSAGTASPALGPDGKPLLAIGSVGSFNAMGQGWDPEEFGRWDSLENAQDGKSDLRKAVHYWKGDPLVYRCTSFLVQLANSRFIIDCPNPEHKGIVENWVAEALGAKFREQWFTEYYKTRFVVTLKTLIPYVARNYKSGKIPQTNDEGNVDEEWLAAKARSDQNQQAHAEYRQAVDALETARDQHVDAATLESLQVAVAAKQHAWVQGAIAGHYTILDPLLVDLDGPLELSWLREPYLHVGGELAEALKNPTSVQRQILSYLPSEIVQQIRSGKEKIWLPPNICSVTCGDKQPYERYPTPITHHCFGALRLKHELTKMDESTARGVRNRILKVTIGNDNFPAFDAESLQALQRTFSSPSRNFTIFWNHTLELEWIEPNLASLQDAKKYQHVNNEIRTAFGISQVLTGTSETAGAIGNNIMNFKGVQNEVAAAQAAYLEFFHRELKLFKKSLGWSDEISGRFDSLNMKNETEMWGVMIQAVINGILDPQSALETMNYHYPTIEDRMKKFKPMRDKGLFAPTASANNLGPGGAKSKGGIKGSPQGGKPKKQPAAKNNKNRVGKSTPKKAKARLLPYQGGVAVVLDRLEIDEEKRQSLCDYFHVAPEQVITAAAYEKSTGKQVSFVLEWPHLSYAETAQALAEAQQLQQRVEVAFQARVEAYKAASAGKRGAYLTQAKRQELQAITWASVVSWDPKPEGWDEHLAQVTAELQQAGIAPDQLNCQAWAICQRRWQKTQQKTVASIGD